MKTFYYILTLISIIFSINDIYAQCHNIYGPTSMPLYSSATKHLNYAFVQAKNQGELKIASDHQFNDLNPFSSLGQTPPYYAMLSFDSLFVAPLDDINNLYPLLATHYCITDYVIDIYINKDAKWNNQDAIVAQDIIHTLNYLKSINHPYYSNLTYAIKSMSAKRDNLLSITFINNTDALSTHKKNNQEKLIDNKIHPNLLIALFTMPILHQKDTLKLNMRLAKEPLITSGYYDVDYYNNNTITLKKNPNYWGANLFVKKYQANFNKVMITYFYNQKKQLLAFNNNELDIYKITDFENLNQYTKTYGNQFIKIKKKTTPPLNALFFNTSKITMQNKNIRKALILAYDSTAIKSQLNPNFTIVKNYKSNLILASKLLDKTDYIYDKNIRKYKFDGSKLNLVIIFNNNYEAKLHQQFITNLHTLGIATTIKILNNYQKQETLKNNDFDIIAGYYLYSNPLGEELHYYFFDYNKTQSIFNYNKLNDNIINDLITKLNDTNYKNQHQELLKQFKNRLTQLDIFITMYYYPYDFYLIKSNIKYQKSAFGLDIWSSYIK